MVLHSSMILSTATWNSVQFGHCSSHSCGIDCSGSHADQPSRRCGEPPTGSIRPGSRNTCGLGRVSLPNPAPELTTMQPLCPRWPDSVTIYRSAWPVTRHG